MSSKRLPGKILMRIAGRPMLDHLVEGLSHAHGLDDIVLATSADRSDDETAEFASRRGLRCHRGPLDDVARRILDAGAKADADAIVRVNGDSPLLDPALVEQGLAAFRGNAADIATNVCPRSFPKGQSVEVIAVAALERAAERMVPKHDREHVTPYIYAHPQAFSIVSFVTDPPCSDIQLSVDDAADFARCTAIVAALPAPAWQVGWRACLSAYDRVEATYAGRDQGSAR
jgi:spore coat polysaccharide biosynthesis protein SpsF (cytidylyltransferase family)